MARRIRKVMMLDEKEKAPGEAALLMHSTVYPTFFCSGYQTLRKQPNDDSLQPGGVHQSISKGNNHHIRNHTAGNASSEEMPDLQVALAGLRILHHDGRYEVHVSTA